MGRRTAIFDHTEVGRVVSRWGRTAYQLEQETPRCWRYWNQRLTGQTALTLEDFTYLCEVTGREPAKAIAEVVEALERGNPGRVKGTLLEVRV